MGVSRGPNPASAPAQTDAEKQKEEQRRIDEQSKWSNAQQWFANFYGHNEKVSRLYWERVEKSAAGMISEAEEADIKERAAANAQASIGQPKDSTFRITDGLFRATVDSKYHSRETSRNFFIELKDGSARPRPPLRESEFASHQSLYMEKFNSVYGQVMDFMAVQCGYSKLEIDLPDMSPVMSQYDHMRLNALMDLAQKKGLHLSFGPKVMETLRDRPREYAQYKDRLDKVNAVSTFAVKKDAVYKNDYQLATKKFAGQEHKGKADFEAAFNTSLDAKDKNVEKLAVVNEELNKLDTRVNELNDSFEALNKNITDFEAQVEGLSTVDTSGDLREQDPNNPRPHGHEEGNDKAIAGVESYIATAEKERTDLIAAMKTERDELIARREVLQAKYDAGVKGYEFPVDKDGKPLSAEKAEPYVKQRDAITGRLEKINETLGKLSDPAMQKVQVERIEALKVKVEEKKKVLEAAKQRPGGP